MLDERVEKKPRPDGLSRYFAFLAALAFLVWLAFPRLMRVRFAAPHSAGEFGDMFGALNALFSALALGGVILAIVLQHRELQLQRRELELTRAELQRSANAQIQTTKELSEQTDAHLTGARLNALSSLISHCDMIARDLSTANATRRNEALEEERNYITEVQGLLARLRIGEEAE